MVELLLFIIALLALALLAVLFFAKRDQSNALANINAAAAERKREGKRKIMEFLQQQGRMKNDDAQKLLNVSDAMATIYLEELEKEGYIAQHGFTGSGVYYTKNG